MVFSKFMMSKPGQQTITICILPNSHEVKATRQIWSLNRVQQDKYFPSNIMQKNEAGNIAPDLFLFFKKAFYKVKASGLQLRFNIFLIALNLQQKQCKILDHWFRDMLSFNFLESVNSFSTTFCA